jgi:hypothetical protein
MARLNGVATSAPVLATERLVWPAPAALDVPDGPAAGELTLGLDTATGPGVAAAAPPAAALPGAPAGLPAGPAVGGPPDPTGAPPVIPPASAPPDPPPAGAPPEVPPAGAPPEVPPAGAPPEVPPAGAPLEALRSLPLLRRDLRPKLPDPVSLPSSESGSSSEASSSDVRTLSVSRSWLSPASRCRRPAGGQSSARPCSSSGDRRGSQQGSPSSVTQEGRRRWSVWACAGVAQALVDRAAIASHIGTRVSFGLSITNRPRERLFRLRPRKRLG